MPAVVIANPNMQLVSGSSDPVTLIVSGSQVLLQTEDSAIKNITVTEGVSGSSPGIYVHGKNESGQAIVPSVIPDIDGHQTLSVSGKVSIVAPTAPSGSEEVIIANDNPLSISSDTNVSYVITSGSSFVVQQVTAGSEGDTTERGSVVEVYFSASDLSSHLVSRVYVAGFTTFVQPNTTKARDGTEMAGDGISYLVVRRRRLSGAAQEVDAVVRGYER